MSSTRAAGMGLALVLLAVPAVIAEDGAEPSLYVEVEVSGPLRPETRWALARLVGRNTEADLYFLATRQGTTAESLCGSRAGLPVDLNPATCLRRIEESVAELELLAAGYLEPEGLRAVPMVTLGNDTFALVERQAVEEWHRPLSDTPIINWPSGRISTSWASEGSGWAETSVLDVVAVPLNDAFFSGAEFVVRPRGGTDPLARESSSTKILASLADATGGTPAGTDLFPGMLAYRANPDDELALIERDIESVGYSEREFRLRSDLTPEEVQEARQIVAADPAAAISSTRAEPRQGFEFIHPGSVTFETTSGDCDPPVDDWPLPAARVARTMCFNERLRDFLGLGPPRRSRILVVDSGLGSELAQDPSFSRGLYIEPSERLALPTMIEDDFDTALCVDADGNKYFSDVYGAGPRPGDGSGECERSSFFLDQIAPIESAPLAKQVYFPGHGGYVAGLALGGRDLLELYPQITSFVGVSFYRVTRRDGSGFVKTESIEVEDALKYADTIRADVVNLSLRTHKVGPFNDLPSKHPTLLLVASAGNNGADLADAAPENLPASMDDPTGHIIVVGALQRGGDSWWPLSAHSPEKVAIAAPGAEVWSFGLDGHRVCSSGTSAAAPLVSFTAATLRALGLPNRMSIRGRILASADHEYGKLDEKVAEGRRLNVEAALDVFVDRVEIERDDGTSETLRGWIVPSTRSTLRICAEDKGSKDLARMRGHIDLSRLWTWRRLPSNRGRFFHRHTSMGPYRADHCNPPQGELRIRLLSGEESQPSWSQVRSILPSPFRSAEEQVLELTSQLLAGAPDADAFSWCTTTKVSDG